MSGQPLLQKGWDSSAILASALVWAVPCTCHPAKPWGKMGVDFASAATGGVLAAKARPTADTERTNMRTDFEKLMKVGVNRPSLLIRPHRTGKVSETNLQD